MSRPCPCPIGHPAAPQTCEWRRVLGQDNYWVSSDGDVWGCRGLMSQFESGDYKCVELWDGRPVRKFVSRLVAEAFLDPAPNMHRVGFRDGERWNCKASNLYWRLPENPRHLARMAKRNMAQAMA